MRPKPKPDTRTLDRLGLALTTVTALVALTVIGGNALRERARLTNEKKALTARLTHLTELSETLNKGEETLRALEANLDDLNKRLPTDMDFESFYSALAAFSKQRDVTLLETQPGDVNKAEGYHELPITIAAQGSVDAINRWLFDMEAHPRLTRIQAMALNTTDTLGVCEIDLSLRIYAVQEGNTKSHV